jgi:exopolysaccharide biosynthesis WecB/TagA/CpsF family protein
MLSVPIDDFDVDSFAVTAARFGADHYGYVVTPNADHFIRLHEDEAFRDAYQHADFVLMDSRFLSKLLRLFGGPRLRTCPGSDLTARLFRDLIAAGDPIVLIGNTVAQADLLRERYGLQNLHHFSPPMGFINDPAAVEDCLQFIERWSPFRYCFLAVGAPQSEIVACALKKRARARGLTVCIGASINFLTGVEKRAPAWMQRLGIEWLFRLASDPSRLAKRYLVRGPKIFPRLLATRFVLRQPPSPQPAHSRAAAPAHSEPRPPHVQPKAG